MLDCDIDSAMPKDINQECRLQWYRLLELAVEVALKTYSDLSTRTMGTMQESEVLERDKLPPITVMSFEAGAVPKSVPACTFKRPGKKSAV